MVHPKREVLAVVMKKTKILNHCLRVPCIKHSPCDTLGITEPYKHFCLISVFKLIPVSHLSAFWKYIWILIAKFIWIVVSLCIILKIWSGNTVLCCTSQVILALDLFLQECEPKMWRSVVIQKGNTLLIQEVQEEDGGNYTCELKFEGKLIRRTVELKVTGKNLFSMPIGKKIKLWNNRKNGFHMSVKSVIESVW